MIDGALFEVELNSKSKGGKCRAILIDFASRLKISEQTDSVCVCVCGTVSVKSILTGSQISDRQVATTKNTRERKKNKDDELILFSFHKSKCCCCCCFSN